MKVAIVGATGFAGANVYAWLRGRDEYELDPWIHSGGNAWDLARHGEPLKRVDITSSSQVRDALEGCQYVVNCSRNGKEVMYKGLANLLRAAREQSVERFVHLSSVAVYGEPPPPESAREDAPAHPARGSYGEIKLQQDRMVEAAAGKGLPCVTLCPPNISGAGSTALVMILEDIRNGTLALVDEGRTIANWVDVRNLAKAVELGFSSKEVDGRRIFVTDGEETTWADTVAALQPLAEHGGALLSFSREEAARRIPEERPPRLNPLRSLMHLVSSDVRAALRQDPLLEKVDVVLRGLVPKMFEDRLRLMIAGPVHVPKVGNERFNARFLATQLRDVRHSCARAREILGYEPAYTFAESMDIFAEWYRQMQGMDSPSWPLLRELHA